MYHRDLNTRIEFKKFSTIARKVIKTKKRENFRQFTSNLNRFSNIKYVWNKMTVFKNRSNT